MDKQTFMRVMDIENSIFETIEFMGKEYPVRFFQFEDEDGGCSGYAAQQGLDKLLVHKDGEFVSEEAEKVSEQIDIFLPDEEFFADEEAFIERMRDFKE